MRSFGIRCASFRRVPECFRCVWPSIPCDLLKHDPPSLTHLPLIRCFHPRPSAKKDIADRPRVFFRTNPATLRIGLRARRLGRVKNMNPIDISSEKRTARLSVSQPLQNVSTKDPMPSKKTARVVESSAPTTLPLVAPPNTSASLAIQPNTSASLAAQPAQGTSSTEGAVPSYTDFSFLPASILRVLQEQGITTPTPVQKAAIGPAMEGRDVLVQAQTGSGKTLAFALPIGLKLGGPSQDGQPRALVLAPTRELANQVEAVFSTTLATLGLRCLSIIGGSSYARQKKTLRDGVDIVVGTPGRIADLIRQNSLQLKQIQCFVLDEVDQMLDIGFAEELNVVKDALPTEIQVLFFSATIDRQMIRVTEKMLRHPVRLDLSSEDATPPNIEHACLLVKNDQRLGALINLLLFHAPKQAMLFCATREECREVASALESRGFNAAPISGDLSQEAREDTLKRFHSSSLQYLVATNVAARGIDIQALPLVLNFDVPPDLESYTHRIGRTGRAGEDGRAWTLVTPQTFYRYRAHMKALDLPLKHLELPSQHDILASIAQRHLTELMQFAETPVHRNVRRITDKLLESIPPEDALELVRAVLQKHLDSLHVLDSRDLSLSKDDLRESDRGLSRARKPGDQGRNARTAPRKATPRGPRSSPPHGGRRSADPQASKTHAPKSNSPNTHTSAPSAPSQRPKKKKSS